MNFKCNIYIRTVLFKTNIGLKKDVAKLGLQILSVKYFNILQYNLQAKANLIDLPISHNFPDTFKQVLRN